VDVFDLFAIGGLALLGGFVYSNNQKEQGLDPVAGFFKGFFVVATVAVALRLVGETGFFGTGGGDYYCRRPQGFC
jgi:hypothetical protein